MMKVLCALLVVARAAALRASDLAYLQQTLDDVATYYNSSFQLAVRWGASDAEAVAFASGASDRRSGKKMTVDAKIPLGSATKPWTAAAALRLHAAKIVDVDAPVAPLVDAMLAPTTMAGLYGPRAAHITLRQLLGMRSGVQDYDDGEFRRKVLGNASFDYEPAAIVGDSNHTLLCAPGSCGAYSSVGYVLAGLALARAAGAEIWTDYDQKTAAVGASTSYPDTLFPKNGACDAYPGVVRQYAPWLDGRAHRYGLYDIAGDSCLNGWTCGNVATSARDLAAFWWSLFRGGDVVDEASLKEMVAFKPLTVGWSVGLEYGLGTMASGWRSVDGKYDPSATLYGHGGEDYGSETEVNGFNVAGNFSVVLAMGSAIGGNCSLDIGANWNAKGAAACYVYDAVLRAAAPDAPRIDCGGRALKAPPPTAAAAPANWTCVP